MVLLHLILRAELFLLEVGSLTTDVSDPDHLPHPLFSTAHQRNLLRPNSWWQMMPTLDPLINLSLIARLAMPKRNPFQLAAWCFDCLQGEALSYLLPSTWLCLKEHPFKSEIWHHATSKPASFSSLSLKASGYIHRRNSATGCQVQCNTVCRQLMFSESFL